MPSKARDPAVVDIRSAVSKLSFIMTRIYNRTSEKEKRRQLRNKMTPAEIILWSRLKNRQVNRYKFRRQYSVGSYVVDFYCPELKLVVEVYQFYFCMCKGDGYARFLFLSFINRRKTDQVSKNGKAPFLRITRDGDIHALDETKENDELRQDYIESLGIVVKRYTNNDIRDTLDSVLDDLYNVINTRERDLK